MSRAPVHTTKTKTPAPRQQQQAESQSCSLAPSALASTAGEMSALGSSLLSRVTTLPPAPVQCAAADGAPGPSGPEVHGIATAGLRGEGQPLPSLERLQPLFGHHDLSRVRAYTGHSAATAARQLGAKAYTVGNQVGFDGPNPSLHIVAHEATHVVQQRAGVHLKSGVGQVGDAYEEQAEAVGRAVTRGENVESMLDRSIGANASHLPAAPPQSAVQLYTVIDQNVPIKLSENGKLMVSGNKAQEGFYATADMIAESNKKLAAVGSFVRFMSREESFGNKPASGDEAWHGSVKTKTHQNQTLYQVKPRWQAKADPTPRNPHHNLLGFHGVSHTNLNKHNRAISAENLKQGAKNWSPMELWFDCGRSSSAVMGSPTGMRSGVYRNLRTQKLEETSMGDANSITQFIHEQMPAFLMKNPQFIVQDKHQPVFNKKSGKVVRFLNMVKRSELLAAYWAMSEQGRRKFDEAVGANSAALPDVGQGYSMRTETSAPDFEHANAKHNTYQFHWAGVVARDGADTVTLEAEANSDNPFAKDTKSWSFNMYGPTYEQSFMKEHLATMQHGNRASVIVTQVPKDKINAHFDYDDEPPLKMNNDALLSEKEKQQRAEMLNRAASAPNQGGAPIPNLLGAPMPNLLGPLIPPPPPLLSRALTISPNLNLGLPPPPPLLSRAQTVANLQKKPPPPRLTPLQKQQAEAAKLLKAKERREQLRAATKKVKPFRREATLAYVGDIINESVVNNLRRKVPPKKRRYFADDIQLMNPHRRKPMPQHQPSDSLMDVLGHSQDDSFNVSDPPSHPQFIHSSSHLGVSQSRTPLELALTEIGLDWELAAKYPPKRIMEFGSNGKLAQVLKISDGQAALLIAAASEMLL